MLRKVCTTLLIITSALVGAALTAAHAQGPQRKNIDLLTAQELAAYEHAIQILKDRSAANPFDKAGYLWQAWVHNCPFIKQPVSGVGDHSEKCDSIASAPDPNFIRTFPGVCEHGKDLFLIWHRAQFYYFEQILRDTDRDGTVRDSRGVTGPSTSNVAVPFWNWNRKPTGVRYPKAFEKEGSPLFHAARNREALTPEEEEALRPVTSAEAVAALVYDADWKEFGGYPQESSLGGSGRFESEHHDLMHGAYVGGDMANSRRAALDPIFFSFHSYIDLVLQWWLDEHAAQSVTSLANFMRATQPDSVKPPPGHAHGAGIASMGQASIYLDPAKLGYGYEVTDSDRLPRRAAIVALTQVDGAAARFAVTEKSRRSRLAGDGLFNPSVGPPTLVSRLAVPVPRDDGVVHALFTRPHAEKDVTYAVDFYLHPGSELDLARKVQREKYIVATRGHFGTGEDGHDEHAKAKPLFVDLSGPLKDLAATGHAGEIWTLTAVVSGHAPTGTFGTLSLARQ